MPIRSNLENMIYRWQSKHNRKLTLEELAELSGISLPTINRIKANSWLKADLDKMNRLCKVLECEPGDLLKRFKTGLYEDERDPENMRYQAMLDGIAAAGEED